MGVVMRSAVRNLGNAKIPACGIAAMAKASVPARTKTRLVPPLTFEQAAQCNTAFVRDIAENILAAAAQSSIAGYIAYGPADAQPFFQANLPPDIALIEACHPSLGECLDHAIANLFERGHRAAVVVNSDSPTLPTSLLLEAAKMLAQPGHRAVLGPALDGGYYLLGVKARHRRLFEDIAWSTQHVARQTQERAAELRLPMHILPTWYDVDDVSALKMLVAELFEGQSFAAGLRPAQPRHTRTLFQSLLESSQLRDRFALDAFRGAAE
jgi:rSAM/selenodomain-associated transferase 1